MGGKMYSIAVLASLSNHQSSALAATATGFFVLCSPCFSSGTSNKNHRIHRRAIKINEGS